MTLAYAEGTSARIPDRPQTRAQRSGDGWLLTGTKNYVLDGAAADLIYVLADTDDGPAVFAVDRDASGLTPTPLTTIDLTRKQYALQLDGTPARLIGELGCGAETIAAALEAGGVALLSEQAGGAHRCMQMAAEYAGTRFQFARAIGSFQAVKHMCADMLTEAESAVSRRGTWRPPSTPGHPRGLADLALAQAYCSDAFVSVAATNIQVHGGIGFTWEHPAHLYLRRARTDAQLLGEPAHTPRTLPATEGSLTCRTRSMTFAPRCGNGCPPTGFPGWTATGGPIWCSKTDGRPRRGNRSGGDADCRMPNPASLRRNSMRWERRAPVMTGPTCSPARCATRAPTSRGAG